MNDMTQDDRPIPLRGLVQNLATQLHALAQTGRAIEDSVGERIQSGGGGQSIGDSLQELDHLVQVLEDLSRFMHGIVPAIDHDAQLAIGGARNDFRLRRLAVALLHGETRHEEVPASGDVDLF